MDFRQSYSTQWESIRWIQFLIAEDTGLDKHQSSEACSAEERGEPGHQLSATTEDEPMPQIGRVKPIPQVLETIWEGSDEDRTSTAPSLLVHDESDEALKEGGETALLHLLGDGASTRCDSDYPESNVPGCESMWSPRQTLALKKGDDLTLISIRQPRESK